MKRSVFFVILSIFLLPCGGYTQNDIFQTKVPNVMIIFDTSASMEMSLNLTNTGGSIWTWKKGPDNIHYYRWDGNHPDSKLYTAKQSLTNIINDVLKNKEVNLGFATYAQMKQQQMRGYYSQTVVYNNPPTPEQWRSRKRYYTWYKANDASPRTANSLDPTQFVDAWGVNHTGVTADPVTGTTFTRTINIHDKNGPLHPAWLGGNSYATNATYTITYRVTNRTLNAETNVSAFTYTVISPSYDAYWEQYFYDAYAWGTSPPDCMQDKKNQPWPDKKKQGKDADNNDIWYYTHFSNDADPTEYITPSGGRNNGTVPAGLWWKCDDCTAGNPGHSDSSCYQPYVAGSSGQYDTYAWGSTAGAACSATIGAWKLMPGTCYDWSWFRYTPEPGNQGNRPHTWSYYHIQGGNWPLGQEPNPFYPAASGGPGLSNNHWFFLNFPDDKDSSFVPSQRQDNYNTIKSFVDLTPVLDSDPSIGSTAWALEYWTKLPIQPSISSSTDAVDMTKCTPLADSLQAAYTYFNDYIFNYQCNGCSSKGDTWSQQAFGSTRCRGNYIILLTDGLESARFKNGQPDYTAAPTVAASLYQSYVQTFVIGFGQDVLQGPGYVALNNIANAGSPPAPNQRNAYFPTNQAQLESALQQIFEAILSDTFGRSNPVMVQSGNLLVRGYFDITSTGAWKGDVEARNVDNKGVITNPFPQPPTWDAGVSLNSNGNRNIYTWVGNSPNPARLPFSTGQSSLYPFVNPLGEDINGDAKVDDNDATTVINFTLDPGYAGGTYSGTREADWKLGDDYHSTPVIVGAPPAFSSDPAYITFAQTWSDPNVRPPMVYAGTNDGMLHGFKLSDGSEVFAVIPKNLLGNLKNLRSSHNFYVDGSPKAADVYVNGQWTTVLVTGERGGGPYYFAIDVTDPLNVKGSGYPKILWEWTDSNMGDSWAKPDIGKIKLGNNTKYVAFITGGYSTTANTSNSFYIVDIETGTTLKSWVNLGGNSNKIPAGATGFDPLMDGYIKYVYFGDNAGTLWKVDLSDTDMNNWTCNVLFTPPAGKRKPVFYPPAVVKNDAKQILVLFGSGDDFNILTPDTSYMWEVWDNNGVGTIIGTNWPAQLDNQKVLATPVVANNVVYFSTWDYTGGGQNCGAGDGLLYGLKTSTGAVPGGVAGLTLLDAQGNPQQAVSSIDLGPGIPSKPVVTNGVIYTTSSVNAKNITSTKVQGWPTTIIKSWREVF